jgi:hypothetical protein
MTTPRTIGQVLSLAQAATAAQQDARDRAIAAGQIAALTSGTAAGSDGQGDVSGTA